MSGFKHLQALYTLDFDGMDKEELEAFLALLQRDKNAPYRNRRIAKVERKLSVIYRDKANERLNEIITKGRR